MAAGRGCPVDRPPEPVMPASTAAATDAVVAPPGPTLDARHSRMARDSLLLTASYGFSALVGVGFWALAARSVPAVQLGVDTAVIAALTAAGAIAANGVGNAVLTMLPGAGPGRRHLLRLAYTVVLTAALAFGAVAGVLTGALLPGMRVTLPTVGAVAGAAAVWSAFVLQDAVLTASGKVAWLLAENVPANAVKVVLLPLSVVLVGSGGHPVAYATIAPALLAVCIVSGVVVPRLIRGSDADGAAGAAWLACNRRPFAVFALRDGAASALTVGLAIVLPFVVTAAAGAVQGAVYALCWQVSYAMDMFTVGVSVSLTTTIAADPRGGFRTARRMWWRLAKIVGGVAALVVVGAPVLLAVFGRTYLSHGGWATIAVLAVGSLVRTAFEVWTGLLRALRRTGVLLAWTTVTALTTVLLVTLLAHAAGAVGAALGLTAATVVPSAVGAWSLWRERPAPAWEPV